MAHSMTNDTTASSLFGAVAVSAIIGMAAGFLLAPKSGRETRDDLVRKMRETQARTRNRTTEMKDELTTTAEDVAAEARSQVEDATTKIELQAPTRSRTRQAPK